MLQSISINNFQSIHEASLDLAPLTVIVGPSSSGKSAFVRALHTLTNNRRGLDFLTHGQRVMSITARTERGTLTLSRGKGTEDNYYELIPTGSPTDRQKWSKLGGAVPEEVSAFLGIAPGPQAFAGQHDMPYMLNDSAPSNATALGRLTNVNVIFDAAREAKRRALEASKTIRLRAEDLSSATASLDRFEHLDEQQHALSMAEEKISAAYTIQRALNGIISARDSLIAAAGQVKRMQAAAAIEVPDVQPAIAAHQSINTLSAARDSLIEAASLVQAINSRLSTISDEQSDLNTEREALRANTENIFRERFEATEHSPDIPIPLAASIAAQTVEDMSA